MLLPGFPSLFRTTKPQRFDYKPIYYDEEKEKRDKERAAGSNNTGSARIKFKPMSSRASMKANLTILILVFLLSALAAYIITY
jgi:hypothetical protein